MGICHLRQKGRPDYTNRPSVRAIGGSSERIHHTSPVAIHSCVALEGAGGVDRLTKTPPSSSGVGAQPSGPARWSGRPPFHPSSHRRRVGSAAIARRGHVRLSVGDKLGALCDAGSAVMGARNASRSRFAGTVVGETGAEPPNRVRPDPVPGERSRARRRSRAPSPRG